MTASWRNQLTDLQRRFLEAFGRRTTAFFLTGGAALAGWFLGHRHTDDLDLFTLDDGAIAAGDRLLRATSDDIGATVEPLQSSTDFRRYLVRRGDDAVVVDLVRERVPQRYPKTPRDGILVDAVEEIVANKICALVGRSEVRDLVDLYALEQAGFRVEDFLADAAAKDGGVTPAVVAWVLSSLSIPADLPGRIDPEAMTTFVRDLEHRMRRLALPDR